MFQCRCYLDRHGISEQHYSVAAALAPSPCMALSLAFLSTGSESHREDGVATERLEGMNTGTFPTGFIQGEVKSKNKDEHFEDVSAHTVTTIT